MFSKCFLKLLLVIATEFILRSKGQECSPDSYNFDQNGRDWGGVCQTGRLQSPIALTTSQPPWNGPRIRFINYNVPLRNPLTLRNDGHSATMNLDPTSEERRAYITGGHLPGRFDAQSVHFHWGSRRSRGSEHTINGQKYDVEMHIVHKNALYPTMEMAVGQPDGLAVLGILIKSTPINLRPSRLNVIFDRLPNIINCGDSTQITSRLTASDLLGNIVTGQFFAYNALLAHSEAVACPDPNIFNYDNHGDDWAPTCGTGLQQSPIELSQTAAIRSTSQKLSFINYDKALKGPVKIMNNGHTAEVILPVTNNGQSPCLVGCRLQAVYRAIQLHFHWGSETSKGSEHTVNSKRFDSELHIVHKRSTYKSIEHALQQPDGFVVLGLLLNCVEKPNVEPCGLNTIFEETKLITGYGSESHIQTEISIADILGNTDTSEFYTYRGSLTTPPCSEAVTWFVFANPLDVSLMKLKNLWQLCDIRGDRLINNYRNLQGINSREVFLRN